MTAYYNENNPYAAQWLRNLIAEGHIASGDVDERSITDVRDDDLQGYTQCHFFAGIGGWSLAARLAGIPDDEPLWTGSCPCQPFSAAGKQQGTRDERHLWPEFERLIEKRRPPVVVGEQVASKLGRQWLSGVRLDLEELGYAVGAVDLCAAGARAPHIRQRLWWVADADGGLTRHGDVQSSRQYRQQSKNSSLGRLADGTADGTADGRREERPYTGRRDARDHAQGRTAGPVSSGDVVGSAFADQRQRGRVADSEGRIIHGSSTERQQSNSVAKPSSYDVWSTYDVVHCTDGKTRRFEPGAFPLAHGATQRVGRLRAYGNAIVPQVAAIFLAAVFDCFPEFDQ